MPLSGTTLKWIAVISMLIDHTAEVLINHNAALTDPIWAQIYVLMRGIGRIAFPIYAFLLVEGFLYLAHNTIVYLKGDLGLSYQFCCQTIPGEMIKAGADAYVCSGVGDPF